MPAHAVKKRPLDVIEIYRLADYLDAALAMGEDFLRQSLDLKSLAPGDGNAAIVSRQQQVFAFAQTARTLELGLTAQLLIARTRAVAVRNLHPQFAGIVGLFVGGTAALADAAAGVGAGLGDISDLALSGGPDVLAYLKSRALVGPDEISLGGLNRLAVTEDFLLAETIHLGTLMDMIAAFLDALDLAFDLYAEPRTTATAR